MFIKMFVSVTLLLVPGIFFRVEGGPKNVQLTPNLICWHQRLDLNQNVTSTYNKISYKHTSTCFNKHNHDCLIPVKNNFCRTSSKWNFVKSLHILRLGCSMHISGSHVRWSTEINSNTQIPKIKITIIWEMETHLCEEWAAWFWHASLTTSRQCLGAAFTMHWQTPLSFYT